VAIAQRTKAGVSVSLFLPAYNERENLGAAIAALDAAAAAATDDYEIIIIEDGSTDGTAVLADELAEHYAAVRVVHQERNAGYGPAVLRGFAEATKEYIFYTDADRQYDYRQFAEFLPRARNFDVLSCYRRHRGDPATRLLLAAAYDLLLRLFFGFPLRDADCSFKFFKRASVRDVAVAARSGFVEAELLLKCRVHGLRLSQAPVRHYARAAGAVSFELFRRGPFTVVKPRAIWDMLVDIIRCWRRLPAYARRVRRARLRADAGLS